jgi:hypothetical protein
MNRKLFWEWYMKEFDRMLRFDEIVVTTCFFCMIVLMAWLRYPRFIIIPFTCAVAIAKNIKQFI